MARETKKNTASSLAQIFPDGKVIAIRGAREHNLKNVDLTIPRDKFVVFTAVRIRKVITGF